MSNLASSEQKINDIEVASDAALTESLFIKIGASINYLIDRTDLLNFTNTNQSISGPSINVLTTIYTIPAGKRLIGCVYIDDHTGGAFSSPGDCITLVDAGSSVATVILTQALGDGVSVKTGKIMLGVCLDAGAVVKGTRVTGSSGNVKFGVTGILIDATA